MKIPDKQLIALGPWPKGLNTVASETAVPKDMLREAVNVDVDIYGGVSRRPGYMEVVSTSDSHSLFAWQDSLVFVEEANLVRFNPVGAQKVVLTTGINPARYMSYTIAENKLYYTNGEQSGCVTQQWGVKPWAIANPPHQPVLTSGGTGALPAAQYQVAITYADATGRESGTGAAAVIAATGSITLSNIPSPGAGYFVRVYMTPPNGDKFFAQAQLNNGVSSHTLYDFDRTKAPLETQFMRPMPPGQIVRHAFGRLWVARDNRLLFSAPLQSGIYAPIDHYFIFRNRITVVEPLIDGIWIGTDAQTLWLSGTNPNEMAQVLVGQFGATAGSSCRQPGLLFRPEFTHEVAYWYGDRGCVLGLPGGQLQPFMEGIIATNVYGLGASLYREENGLQQMITAVRNNKINSRVAAVDSAEGFVRLNGVIIQ